MIEHQMNRTTPVRRATALLAVLGTGIALLGLDAAKASVVGLGRVSVSTGGAQSNSNSLFPDISADGSIIAFESGANNLVPGDTNGATDIFVHNRQTGETRRVSVASDGTQGNFSSIRCAISGDGRFVAFSSEANNLTTVFIPEVRPGVYVHDLQTGATEKVDLNNAGEPGLGGGPSLSHDGRLVAFHGSVPDLPASHVYVRDRVAGTTVLASSGPLGEPGNAESFNPRLSGNGQFVTFSSSASNLVPNDTNGLPDIFVVDLSNGVTERVDVGPNGEQGTFNGSAFPDIDETGRYVAFQSSYPNLVPGDTNQGIDIFRRDRQLGVTTRVSVGPTGEEAPFSSVDSDISGNGRFVSFNYVGDGLVPGDANGALDVFVRDLQTGQLEIVSKTPAGQQTNGDAYVARMNHDGDFVVFYSGADNLVPNDDNLSSDIFVVEVQNRTPVASAGADQGLTIPHDGNPNTNTIGVNLSAAASSDPDGDRLSLEWRDAGGNVLGTAAELHLDLAAGSHTFTLEVTDPDGAFSEDTVTVNVTAEPNGPPHADAGKNQTVKSNKKRVIVGLKGRQSMDPDQDQLTYSWMEGDHELATEANPSVKLTRGKHRITLTTTDPYGAMDTDEVVITVKRK